MKPNNNNELGTKRLEDCLNRINDSLFIMKLFNPYIIQRKIKNIFQPVLGILYQYAPRRLMIPKRYYATKILNATPRISIVTPSYNQGRFIERTILSVLQQNYPNLEYIVQDGASKDKSLAIINKYKQSLKHWESIKDKGQANAINLGFKHATGEIMAYLNSDDLLLPGTLNYIVDYFNKHPEVDVIYGQRIILNEDDNEIGRWILPKHCDEIIRWVDYIPQETLFWRRRIWEKVGGELDESFNFAMDWNLIIRFQDAGAKFARLPRFLGGFRVHSQQKTSAMEQVGIAEVGRVRAHCHGYTVSHFDINRKSKSYLNRHVIANLFYRLGILRY